MLTDGQLKYIWRPATGSEQLFDLQSDPGELHNIGDRAEMMRWRSLMVEELKGRPEGFSDGEKLVSGCEYGAVLPHAT